MARKIAIPNGISTRSIQSNAVQAHQIHEHLFNGEYVYGVLNDPVLVTGANGFGPPSGVDTENFVMHLPSGKVLGTYIGGSTALVPLVGTFGLRLSLDVAAAEGAEYAPGMVAFANPLSPLLFDATLAYPGSFFRARLNIATVANVLTCMLGFRESGGVSPSPTFYEDFAALDVNNGQVNRVTNSNNAGIVTADTGFDIANLTTFELEARVTKSLTGGFVVTLYLDGVQVGASFTLHSNVSFAHFFLQIVQEGAGSAVEGLELEAGRLYQVANDPDRR